MRITLFDYKAGNIHSLAKALAKSGQNLEVHIEADPFAALKTELLVLPGVGAFGSAAELLAPARIAMKEAVEGGLPCLGICLGMQLMFEKSEEGPGEGLGLFKGESTRLKANRVPHIGWNFVAPTQNEAKLPLSDEKFSLGYYAHGFACRPEDESIVCAKSEHEGDTFPAAVRSADGRILGLQFHPEKSSDPGLSLLSAFIKELRK